MWQSLSFGANYKAAYCMAVCPAGEDVIGPYLESKSTHLQEVVRPLQHKAERVYVLANSDAEAHVARRFPNKTTKRVKGSLRPRDIEGFLSGLHLTFNPGQAKDLRATYHFTFTGREEATATVRISGGTLEVERGHVGKPHLRVQADSETWLRFLRKDASLLWALITRKIRLRGAPTLLVGFGRCFPS